MTLQNFEPRWLHSDNTEKNFATLTVKPENTKKRENLYDFTNIFAQLENTIEQAKKCRHLQRIFDFTISLVQKCAQTDKPNELLDKYLPNISDDEDASDTSVPPNPLEMDPPPAVHPAGAPFATPRNRVDRKYTRKRYKKKGIVRMRIDLESNE